MKLLLDMNLAPAWAEVLRLGGHEAVHWSNCGALDAFDSHIMQFAREQRFTVITCDLDFGAILAATQAHSPSVVQIRADDVRPQVIAAQLLKVLKQFEVELVAGALLTVELERSRVRILPFANKP